MAQNAKDGRVYGHIYVVNCPERADGLYLFTDRGHADRFREAVISNGGDAVLSEEPVIEDDMAAEALIKAEGRNE